MYCEPIFGEIYHLSRKRYDAKVVEMTSYLFDNQSDLFQPSDYQAFAANL